MKYVLVALALLAGSPAWAWQWKITDRAAWVVTDRGEAKPAPAPEPPPKPKVSAYDQAQADAVAQGKPLAIFVECDPRPIAGWLTVRADSLAGVKGPAILTAKVQGGKLHWHETLSSAATNERIRGEVSASGPVPFAGQLGLSPSPERQTADDDYSGRGPWPKEFEFPVGFERYKPAEYTQSIFTLNSSPAIERVPRSSLLAKWHQPGGLEGVSRSLWRSESYRKLAGPAVAFQTRLPVKNSFGFYQQELGWTRQYPEGSQFMDVLSNRETGQVFEIRLRTKENGTWTSEVDYRNRAHRPLGYRPVSVSECNGCHQEAGTGGYAVGLVPGSDTVLSDPFPALELGK